MCSEMAHECYVAFLDILGFKALVNNYTVEKTKAIFDELMEFKPSPLMKDFETYQKIKYYIMSDSLVVYVEVKYEGAFIALLDVCSQIQIKLLRNNPPVLVRGGIERGEIYDDERIIFGTGLVKAYMLENSLAKYPRIVFAKKTMMDAEENSGKLALLADPGLYYDIDSDMLCYVNYLSLFGYIPSMKIQKSEELDDLYNEHYAKLKQYVEDRLNEELDYSVREKYMWLQRKIENQIEHMPLVKKYFEEVEARNQTEMIKRKDALIDKYAKKE